MPRPDDLMEVLVDKLGKVSPVWTKTFPPTTAGYAALQKLIAAHGYGAVKSALQYAVDHEIVPRGRSAMPVMQGLMK